MEPTCIHTLHPVATRLLLPRLPGIHQDMNTPGAFEQQRRAGGVLGGGAKFRTKMTTHQDRPCQLQLMFLLENMLGLNRFEGVSHLQKTAGDPLNSFALRISPPSIFQVT